jgi:hypothetical protein
LEKYEYDIEKKMEQAWSSYYETVSGDVVEKSWKSLESRIKNKPNKLYKRISLAAAIFVLLFSTYYFIEIYNPTITIQNYGQVEKEVRLPDGSLVLLKHDSEIRYKESFENKRGVKLNGQAFFNIVKDSSKEFKVETATTTTRVLGTSFLVTEDKISRDTEVSLYSGRVLMSVKDNQGTSWAIIPGESFVYEKGHVLIKKFETNLSFETGNKFSDLNNIPLEKLFDFLHDRFHYRFITNEYTINKRVTLRINKSDSLPQILNLLSIINHMNYEINKADKEVHVFQQ